MSRRGLLALGVFLPIAGLVGLLGWALAQSGGRPGGLGINSVFGEVQIKQGPAPALSLPLLNGELLSLSDLKGKVVMVDFWSSWCPPCIAEANDLEATYRRYKSRGVEFVGVAIWDDLGAIQRHVRRFNVTYPNGLDDQGKVAVDYGVRGIPEKFFIDRDGNLVKKYVGPASPEKLGAILDGLLAQAGQ